MEKENSACNALKQLSMAAFALEHSREETSSADTHWLSPACQPAEKPATGMTIKHALSLDYSLFRLWRICKRRDSAFGKTCEDDSLLFVQFNLGICVTMVFQIVIAGTNDSIKLACVSQQTCDKPALSHCSPLTFVYIYGGNPVQEVLKRLVTGCQYQRASLHPGQR